MSPLNPQTPDETSPKSGSVSTEFSDQLRKTSLVSISMIIGIHSYNLVYLDTASSDSLSSWALWIQEWISNWLFRIGTPTFMAISGYMFFWSFLPTLKSYQSKVVKRIRNLAIPFLLWSSLGMLVFVALQAAPPTRAFFSEPYLYQLSWKTLLHIWIMDPVPYQLWFLRDLVIMCLISPVIYFLLKGRVALLVLAAGFSIWFFNLQEVGVNNKTSFFYLLGAWCAIRKRRGTLPDFRKWLQIKPALSLSLIIWVTLSITGAFIKVDDGNVIEPIYKIQILSGMNCLWYGYIFWGRFLNFLWVDQVKTLTFFIYASHEPYTRIVCKGLLKLFPEGSLVVMVVYFLTMGLVFTGCSLVGIVLKRRFPAVYAPLSGWR